MAATLEQQQTLERELFEDHKDEIVLIAANKLSSGSKLTDADLNNIENATGVPALVNDKVDRASNRDRADTNTEWGIWITGLVDWVKNGQPQSATEFDRAARVNALRTVGIDIDSFNAEAAGNLWERYFGYQDGNAVTRAERFVNDIASAYQDHPEQLKAAMQHLDELVNIFGTKTAAFIKEEVYTQAYLHNQQRRSSLVRPLRIILPEDRIVKIADPDVDKSFNWVEKEDYRTTDEIAANRTQPQVQSNVPPGNPPPPSPAHPTQALQHIRTGITQPGLNTLSGVDSRGVSSAVLNAEALKSLPIELQDRAREAYAEIFEKAGKRSEQELTDLMNAVIDILKNEHRGKMLSTIDALNNANLTESIREGQIQFIPAGKGEIVSIGDIHGDLEAVEKVLRDTSFLERMQTGEDIRLLFHGDLIDRGKKSPEALEALFTLKQMYPDQVFIIWGDHDRTDKEDDLAFQLYRLHKDWIPLLPADKDVHAQNLNNVAFPAEAVYIQRAKDIGLTEDEARQLRNATLKVTMALLYDGEPYFDPTKERNPGEIIDEFYKRFKGTSNEIFFSRLTDSRFYGTRLIAETMRLKTTYKKYAELFNELPNVLACGNGVLYVHGGPDIAGRSLDQLAQISNRADVLNVFYEGITWGDIFDQDPINIPIQQKRLEDERERLRQFLDTQTSKADDEIVKFNGEDWSIGQLKLALANMQYDGAFPNEGRTEGGYIDAALQAKFSYTQECLARALRATGAKVLVRGHNPYQMGIAFNGQVVTIHTTGKGSPKGFNSNSTTEGGDSGMGLDDPNYVIFSLQRDSVQKVTENNLYRVWEDNQAAIATKFPFVELAEAQSLSTAGAEVFDRVYGQLRDATSVDPLKGAERLLGNIKRDLDERITSIEAASLDDIFTDDIWGSGSKGIAKYLQDYANTPGIDTQRYEDRKQQAENIYTALMSSVKQLAAAGEVDELTAKVFVHKLLMIKFVGITNYNDLVGNHEDIDQIRLNSNNSHFAAAVYELRNKYNADQIEEHPPFYHINPNTDPNLPTQSRIYISASLNHAPQEVVRAWMKALEDTGMKDKVYFKVGDLAKRYDSIIIYLNKNNKPEDIQRLMEAFMRNCPQDSLSEKSVPGALPLAKGLSYAPELGNINRLLKFGNQESASYNEIIASLTRLAFDLAYDEANKRTGAEPTRPKDLRDKASQYFVQLLRLSGINPETMIPNTQGGKLPAWAEAVASP